MDRSELAAQVKRYGWYHTFDLGDGVVTAGMFDHRPVLHRYGIPDDLSGMRCLDVATMDGYWAFEMERRGAAEVFALDIEDPEDTDWPASLRSQSTKTMGLEKGERFALVHGVLDSKVTRVLRSVYDLGTELGSFDVVFCGDLLVHLKDPMTALERMRLVCRGQLIVCNPISSVRVFGRHKMVAEFDGIDEFQWWLPTQATLERMVLAAGFSKVRGLPPFNLPGTAKSDWKGRRGVVIGYVCARSRRRPTRSPE